MPAYKTYSWEQETWPQYREIEVNRMEQEKYIKKMVRHFKTPPAEVRQSFRRGGAGCYHPVYSYGWVPLGGRRKLAKGYIKLGKVSNLGTVVHEFAHHLEYFKYGKGGHRKTFKKALKQSYTWAKRWLPKN